MPRDFPYISITGFTSPGEVRRMLNVFRHHSKLGREVHFKLGVGVTITRKTLNDLPTKWSAICPTNDLVADIFVSDGKPQKWSGTDYWLFNKLHYADFDGIDILANLFKATQFGGKNMNALQLDMIWPDPEILRAYREKYPNIKIILQINRIAFDQIANDPEKLVERLLPYGKTINYVLLDKSMARGLPMKAHELEPFVKIINPRTSLEVVVAGGLGPDTLHLLGETLPHYLVSIDAQAQLCEGNNALNPTDWDRAGEYLRKALSLLE